jgi:hypothetical protein
VISDEAVAALTSGLSTTEDEPSLIPSAVALFDRRSGPISPHQDGSYICHTQLSMVLALPMPLYSYDQKWGTYLWHLMKC